MGDRVAMLHRDAADPERAEITAKERRALELTARLAVTGKRRLSGDARKQAQAALASLLEAVEAWKTAQRAAKEARRASERAAKAAANKESAP